jgi:DnaJ-class molecular chaperone
MGNSSFYMPGGWTQINTSTKNAAEFKRGNDTHLIVQELTQDQYNTNYNNATKQRSNVNTTQETRNMSGVEVKIVRTTTENGNVYDFYFFQKNGKYYQVSGWDNTNKAASRLEIDNAVNTIINTLKVVNNNTTSNNSTTSKTNSNSSNNNNNNNNNNNGGTETCPTCDGAGVVPVNPSDPNTSWKACPTCDGDGLV